MKKIRLVTHEEHREKILEILYDRGFIEVVGRGKTGLAAKTAESGAAKNEYELAKVKYALDFLAPLKKDDRPWADRLVGAKKEISAEEMARLAGDYDYLAAAGKAEELSREINTLNNLVAKLTDERDDLAPWAGLPFKIEFDRETERTKTIFGLIPDSAFDEARRKLDKATAALVMKISATTGRDETVRAAVIFLQEDEPDAAKILATAGFKEVELPDLAITPTARLNEIETQLARTAKDLELRTAEARRLAEKEGGRLELAFDHLSWRLARVKVQSEFDFTEKTFIVTGWIKASRLDELKEAVGMVCRSFAVIEIAPEAGEEPPIVMENARLIKPIEFVTNIYGYPKYAEIDPTPFLAGFFIVFFGLCLTDAGYGLVLLFGSALALKFLKITGGFRKLLWIIFYGSILTVGAGAFTGGWFGISLDELAAGRLGFLARPLIALRQFDPVKEPITMLIISLILGYIHLVFGNALNMWWKIKNKETKEAFLGPAVWLYFLLTIGFFVVASQGIAFAALATLAKYLVYSALLAVVATQGKGKNPFAKLFGGAAELYFGVSGYVSDILSYSRLLALGLATGIIGMVINIVGLMAYEMIPYVGLPFMILILIGGHALNLVISLVGAFIHSGRLQYVEFFKTFFNGGGREFAPFVRQSKYVTLINKK